MLSIIHFLLTLIVPTKVYINIEKPNSIITHTGITFENNNNKIRYDFRAFNNNDNYITTEETRKNISLMFPKIDARFFDYKGFNELKMNADDVALNINRAIGNQDFFLNIIDYMMGESFMLDIRSRQIDVREIDKEKIQQSANYYKLINMLLPIALIVLLGLIMNFIRKKRFTRK